MGFLKDFKEDFSQAVKELSGTGVFLENPVNEAFFLEESEKVQAELIPEAQEERTTLMNNAVTIIARGMIVKGDIFAEGSLEIHGEVYGNIECSGKLFISGTVKGDSTAAEIFTDAAQMKGRLISAGILKIGEGSVIIGDVSAVSALVAGTLKGNLDAEEEVIVDKTAVVIGNIKSRFLQIDDGAVISGSCFQSYMSV